MPHEIVLDGAHGEGSGSLVRTALAMSALTQQAVRIENLRGATRYPGVDAEDMVFAKALVKSCDSEVEGLYLGSNTLAFSPRCRPRALDGELENVKNSLGRGASIPILMSGLLPVLARSGAYSCLAGTGETYGSHALGYDAFAEVVLPTLRRFGLYAFSTQESPGFGREAAGQMSVEVEPSALVPIDWSDRGKLQAVRAIVAFSGIPPAVAHRGASHLRRLGASADLPLVVDVNEFEAPIPGIHLTVWAKYDRAAGCGAAVGTRGVRIEVLAQTAFEELFTWMRSEATVDPYLTDHLLLPAVLADGASTWKVSRLTKRFMTMIWVVKQFTPIHITVRGLEDGPGTIVVRRA